jgi:hypothetical protein
METQIRSLNFCVFGMCVFTFILCMSMCELVASLEIPSVLKIKLWAWVEIMQWTRGNANVPDIAYTCLIYVRFGIATMTGWLWNIWVDHQRPLLFVSYMLCISCVLHVAVIRKESECASKAMEQSDMKFTELGGKIRGSSKMVHS